jgi:hypothetical protein
MSARGTFILGGSEFLAPVPSLLRRVRFLAPVPPLLRRVRFLAPVPTLLRGVRGVKVGGKS